MSREPFEIKVGLAEMLKGGVIMDVTDADQAKIAEDAGACAVMALERIPADIRKDGGISRMSDPEMIKGIQDSVSIPVMAKCRIGHFAEAQVLETLEVDFIDESEVLTPADEHNHIWKHEFKIPFVCGCRNLGEALRRIAEGAAMIRTKGEAGSGNIVEAVRHMRTVMTDIKRVTRLDEEELVAESLRAINYNLGRILVESGLIFLNHLLMNGIISNLYLFHSCLKLKTRGKNNTSNKIIKKLKLSNKIKVNLNGDNLYKVKVNNV